MFLIGENLMQKKESQQIITDIRSLLNQTVMTIQNKKYGRTLASIEDFGKI